MFDVPLEVLEFDEPDLDVTGYVCLSSLGRGVAFGGCRFDPSVTREDVVKLARCMSAKLAGHGLPCGGAKGGLRVEPRRSDILAVVQRFAERAAPLLTSTVVLGKDLGASNELMDHLYACLGVPQLHLVQRLPGAASVPDRLRELRGYVPHMTGQGVAWATRAAVDRDVAGLRVLIQGAGAVGMGSAVRLSRMGAQIVGICDVEVAVMKRSGFAIDALLHAVSQGRIDPSDPALQHDEVISPRQMLVRDADVLVLAAASNTVDLTCAANIRAGVVVEGSNFGLVEGGHAVLSRRGVLAIPDVIASSSSAAMVAHQIAARNTMSPEVLWSGIEASIDRSVRQAIAIAKVERTSVRDAYLAHIVPIAVDAAAGGAR
jgi:glutamate dehydrogenase (NAD(P)+)